MLSEPSYLPARIVASKIEAHFALHLNAAQLASDQQLAFAPSAAIIEAIIDVAFWASLRREEGHPPKISLAFLPPEQAGSPLIFQNRLRLTPQYLTKLAAAVEQPGVHLGVWNNDDGLYVWGTTHNIPGICFVLEVIEPGLLVIKHRRIDGFGKFVNIAVLRGDEIKVIDEQNSSLANCCPALLQSILEMPLPSALGGSFNILVELATVMRAHNRGALVLIVPTNSYSWHKSIIHPISYPVDPPYCAIPDLLKNIGKKTLEWKQAMRNAIDIIGGFTAVDGATIINRDNELLAFGAKIARSELSIPVDQMIMTEPVTDSNPIYMHPAQNGGTRHLAAAQFVYDQRDAQAMVASQDGHFTLFAWSEQMQMVHAHRIDILLM